MSYLEMPYFKAHFVFYALAFIASVICIIGFIDHIRIWWVGKRQSIHVKPVRVGRMLKAFFIEVLFQLHVLKQNKVRWFIHILIFWGFLGLLVLTGWEAVVEHLLAKQPVGRYFLLGVGKSVLDFWGDFFGLLLLLGLVLALVRRYVLKPWYIENYPEDIVAVWFLILVVVTGFIAEGARLSLVGGVLPRASFLGNWVAQIFRHISLSKGDIVLLQWIHIGVSLLFIAYLPFGKMLHLFAAPIEICINASEESHRRDVYDW